MTNFTSSELDVLAQLKEAMNPTVADMEGACKACLYDLVEEVGCTCNEDLTTKEELTMNNTTKQEVVSMEDMNKSALISTMAAELFHNGLSPINSFKVASAYIGAVDYIEDSEEFLDEMLDGLALVNVRLTNPQDQKTTVEYEDVLDTEEALQALAKAKYLTVGDEVEVGPRLADLCAQRTEAYMPVTGEIERRFGYAPVAYGDLFVEAVHALESTEYTVDTHMLSVALQVQAAIGEDEDKEGYVIKGCQKMDPTLAYKSEFKGDRRGRLYQAACHGPNGQASDRSRALMDLVGVPTDYDVQEVYIHIMHELQDMTKDVKLAAQELNMLGEVQFIINNLDKNNALVSKPWSFVKAARIMKELKAGNRPYIGMAVGLDAKCSGPQLAALMVGDKDIAQACGMSLVEMDDAYKLAIKQLEKAGFVGFTRNGIKKPYMGIFYGQGWEAFTKVGKMIEDGMQEVVDVLYGTGPANDDVAKAFHKAIMTSFGSKMNAVRNKIKDYSKKTQGRTKHFMPDGFEVAMNYKVKVNALGEMMEYDTARYDLVVNNNADTHKFINMQLRTKSVHVGDFARNGFVNMIQATDALLARLIIVHLDRLGAKHIIAVHDCFRVNVTEMGLLKQAIINAYMDLFGWVENKATKDLPKGTDILAMYFEGANKQLLAGEEPNMVNQFRTTSGKRKMPKIQGLYLSEVIQRLGDVKEGGSYYFAK